MPSGFDRRLFLEGLGKAGAALLASTSLGRAAYAASGPARAVLSRGRYRSELDRRLLGAFLEHLGRAIYTGVYEPGSPLADANGFRTDVIAEVKGLGVPIMRYPGGNFVSGYNWLDGVGPKDKRPTVLERAWNSLETESVRHERVHRVVQARRHRAAARLQPRHRHAGDGRRLRRVLQRRPGHEVERPAARRTATSSRTTCAYWCLGNEMDGPWQMGHMPAREYGRKARDAAPPDSRHRSRAAS